MAARILNFIAVFAATFHSFLEDQRSTRPSDLLILYFSASVILSLPRLRTLWLITGAGAPRGLWTAIIILTILVVPLESIGKKRFLRTEYRTLTKEEETGFWGRSFFTWLMPFFRLGYSRVIHIRDMPEVDKDLAGDRARSSLDAAWSKRKGQKYHALIRSSFYAYRGALIAGVLTRLFLSAFTFCQPFLITATNMPGGELYIIGSNGVGLSGGQRQRVALARAVYSRHRVVVLDDVLSGLDSRSVSQISSRLFSEDGHFRRNKISVILATHNQDDENIPSGEDSEPADEVVKPTQIQRTLDAEEDRLRQNGSWSVYKYYFERADLNLVDVTLPSNAINFASSKYFVFKKIFNHCLAALNLLKMLALAS
ncbi:uncharacterized protein N0V96_011454 [Colletotrichum fioriniae]|uniref:uncharacterized protein n=1 Tax=Colletotrichum fioriniae TaxID=710243 RepID=UPI0032DA525B|nr:hypothetical protein N0V96_011454 [Colletotrichum fioriniae]